MPLQLFFHGDMEMIHLWGSVGDQEVTMMGCAIPRQEYQHLGTWFMARLKDLDAISQLSMIPTGAGRVQHLTAPIGTTVMKAPQLPLGHGVLQTHRCTPQPQKATGRERTEQHWALQFGYLLSPHAPRVSRVWDAKQKE